MSITATERGMNLALTIGDESDSFTVVIPPVGAKVGTMLLALWAGIAFGQSDQADVDAEAMSRLAVGSENWEIIQGSEPTEDGSAPQYPGLRWAVADKVINAAFFWNSQGGSLEQVQALLDESAGGFPKAQELLLRTNGLWEEFELLQTLLSGASENPTPSPGDTPDTSTPSGTETASSSTLDRLPNSKRSINQS